MIVYCMIVYLLKYFFLNMYVPVKYKYKKQQKQLYRLKGNAQSNFFINFNAFLIKNLVNKRINPQQFESFRRVVKRLLKRHGILRGFFACDLPITSKSTGVRMGKGKGNVNLWSSSISRGKVLYSLSDINSKASFFVFKKASKKLPVKVFFKCLNISSFFLSTYRKFFY